MVSPFVFCERNRFKILLLFSFFLKAALSCFNSKLHSRNSAKSALRHQGHLRTKCIPKFHRRWFHTSQARKQKCKHYSFHNWQLKLIFKHFVKFLIQKVFSLEIHGNFFQLFITCQPRRLQGPRCEFLKKFQRPSQFCYIFSFFSTYQKQPSYDILIDVCVSSNAYESTILLKMSNKSQVRMSAICFHQ